MFSDWFANLRLVWINIWHRSTEKPGKNNFGSVFLGQHRQPDDCGGSGEDEDEKEVDTMPSFTLMSFCHTYTCKIKWYEDSRYTM